MGALDIGGSSREPIAIVGIGCRLPGGADDRMFLQWKVETGAHLAGAVGGTHGAGTGPARGLPGPGP